jgi:hypothetical protein
MRRIACGLLMLLGVAAAPARAEVPVTLRGSRESMARQNAAARQEGLPFVQTPAQMRALAAKGGLVRLQGNADYGLRGGMRSALARPEMRVFVERLGAQYRQSCGERLIVTSMTRPATRQPGNAHALSVHPTGIAVDLRVSKQARCRQWLEATLLSMEARGLLDVTREYRPPHYHVALFPQPYLAHVRRLEEGATRGRGGRERLPAWPHLVTVPLVLSAGILTTRPSRRSSGTAGRGSRTRGRM